MKTSSIREASHAGSWYLSDPNALNKQLDGYLSKAAPTHAEKEIKAIIAPHAGFDYSGPTAAFAYKQFRGKPSLRVFLLGPSHHVYIKGLGLSQLDKYGTPLGSIPLDKETIAQVAQDLKKGFVYLDKDIEEQEHSLELHLPYIYKAFPDCKLVPIMVGTTDPQMELNVASVLVKYFEDPNTVFVASTDFCHWGKRFSYTPYKKEDGQIYQSIEKLDHRGIELITQHKTKEYYQYLEDTQNTVCGRHPVGILLNILNLTKLKLKTELVKYAQSSAVTEPRDSSVSYASIVTYVSE